MTANSIVIAVAAINVCLALANLVCCILRCLEDKQEEVRRNEDYAPRGESERRLDADPSGKSDRLCKKHSDAMGKRKGISKNRRPDYSVQSIRNFLSISFYMIMITQTKYKL